MNVFKKILSNISTTENGAITLKSSLNHNLDFFFISGTFSEHTKEEEILDLFYKAFKEDENLALKNLFHLRDIREGKGIRRALKIIWKSLPKEIIKKLEKYVPEYGRYDDIFETSIDYIAELLKNPEKTENFSLLCKWIPRKGKLFFKIAKKMDMKVSDFRKFIVKNTNVVENQMCKKEWDQIQYDKIPSLEFLKYKKAFKRNDENRYNFFIESVSKGEKSLNTKNILPHQVYKEFLERNISNKEIKVVWENLENVVGKSEKSFVPVCDVSGSMEGIPMLVSISLGVYLSEKNNSGFKDFVVSFSKNPDFFDLSGKNIIEKFETLESMEWGYNTNLQKVFDIILEKAKENKLKDNDMADSIIILSDMEFDEAAPTKTNLT